MFLIINDFFKIGKLIVVSRHFGIRATSSLYIKDGGFPDLIETTIFFIMNINTINILMK